MRCIQYLNHHYMSCMLDGITHTSSNQTYSTHLYIRIILHFLINFFFLILTIQLTLNKLNNVKMTTQNMYDTSSHKNYKYFFYCLSNIDLCTHILICSLRLVIKINWGCNLCIALMILQCIHHINHDILYILRYLMSN